MRKFTNIAYNNNNYTTSHFIELDDIMIIEMSVYDKYTLEYKGSYNINDTYTTGRDTYRWSTNGPYNIYSSYYNNAYGKGTIASCANWNHMFSPFRYAGKDKNPLVPTFKHEDNHFHMSWCCSGFAVNIISSNGEYIIDHNNWTVSGLLYLMTDEARAENTYNLIYNQYNTNRIYCRQYNIHTVSTSISSETAYCNYYYKDSNIINYNENTTDPYYNILSHSNRYIRVYRYYRKSDTITYYTYIASGDESSYYLPVKASDGTYVNPFITRFSQTIITKDLSTDDTKSLCLMASLLNNVDNDTIYIDLPEDVYGTSSTSGTYGDISNDEYYRSYPYIHLIEMNHDSLEFTNYMLDVDWSAYSDYDYFDSTDSDTREYSYSKNIFIDADANSENDSSHVQTESYITEFDGTQYLIGIYHTVANEYSRTKMIMCVFTFDLDAKTATLVDEPFIFMDNNGKGEVRVTPINENLNEYLFTFIRSGSYDDCNVILNLKWTPDTGWVESNAKTEYNNNGWIYRDSLDRIWSVNSKWEMYVGKLDDDIMITIDSYSDIEWDGEDIVKTYKFSAKDLLGGISSNTDINVEIKTNDSTVTFSDGSLSQTITTDDDGYGVFDLLITGVNEFELIMNKA